RCAIASHARPGGIRGGGLSEEAIYQEAEAGGLRYCPPIGQRRLSGQLLGWRGNRWHGRGGGRKGILPQTPTGRPFPGDEFRSKVSIGRFYGWLVFGFVLSVPAAHAQTSNLAESYLKRGNSFYVKGNLDEAIADYNAAIAFDPKFAQAYYNRGLSQYAKGD